MNVIDISKWQETYHAAIAKAQGIDTVILRCAYASSKDVKFDQFYATAKAAGQTVGAYGFATWHYESKNGGSIFAARTEMIAQTNAWIAICKGKLDGFFAIDQELERGCIMGLTPTQNEILLNECIDMLTAAGFVVCVYCSASWAMAQFNKDNIHADLWLAYYYADPFDPDFGQEANYKTADGVYFAYMRSCGNQLCGWQFGRIGYGAKYGVGSTNVDKNVFYKTAVPVQSTAPFSPDAVRLICGYASSGDVATINATFARLYIPTTTSNGFIISDIAVSSGDQSTIRALCNSLMVPCQVYVAPGVEPEIGPAPEQLTDKQKALAMIAISNKLLGWAYELLQEE